ncbi:MAG: MBL fold metallo-hydrolase [Deltaproteobacteria bacterium]|nr:MBL fold metallo-hydrolase [Deltaproteobacteria bacterium]
MLQATDRRFGAVTVLVGEKTGKYPDGNSLLVRGRDATALLDPSLSVHRRAADLGAVDLVVQTHVHEDHVAGLSRFPHARVAAHRADCLGLRDAAGLLTMYGYGDGAAADALRAWIVEQFHYAPRPDVEPFDDGAVFELGGTRVRAIHLPGHTRGHSALLVEPEGVLFLGDIDLTGFGPYYGDAWSNLADFERSLARVRDIPARVWVSFHHAGVIEDRATFDAKLARFAGRIAEREAALLDYLGEPRTLAELVARRFLYPPHAEMAFVDAAERRTIAQHLERLVESGRVVESTSDTWRRA